MHTKQVAATLGCSPKTVEEYWRRMLCKAARYSRQAVITLVLAEALGRSREFPDVRLANGECRDASTRSISRRGDGP
jgi:hypothetical protein